MSRYGQARVRCNNNWKKKRHLSPEEAGTLQREHWLTTTWQCELLGRFSSVIFHYFIEVLSMIRANTAGHSYRYKPKILEPPWFQTQT
mmetsp:Transcript_150458/g.288234  ORF Transcript_150458/g.288234 Transcript_150458/m.288234 type:complete len:88 (+) Transcript_150458:1377-1640(+)